MRWLFAPEFQAQHPDLMRDRREAFLRSDPEAIQAACAALLPDARLKIIAGCAHVPQLLALEMFLDAIGDLLPEPSAAM
jgi:3-oxoadipate enol-lactonase